MLFAFKQHSCNHLTVNLKKKKERTSEQEERANNMRESERERKSHRDTAGNKAVGTHR